MKDRLVEAVVAVVILGVLGWVGMSILNLSSRVDIVETRAAERWAGFKELFAAYMKGHDEKLAIQNKTLDEILARLRELEKDK